MLVVPAKSWNFEISLCVLYVLLFGYLLAATGSLPYVMDNNESFSSWWHARNLFEFGFAKSYGLADESFAYHAAAHPYLHTHQGNFPRLFAFLIYIVGARTAETQIAVTTFTIGLAAIGMIYAFFARIANPWFAFTVCAVFMTDYILFAQWHVVTYRVWHSFFLFGCLLSVHLATESDKRRWWWLTALAFAGLFYWELVFAAFVGAFCFLYAATRTYRSSLRRLVLVTSAQAIGAMVGLGVVVAQVVGYLGPEDLRRDIYFTFFARTDFSLVANLMNEVAKFYESRHVVFWHNFEERSKFAGPAAFVRSFTSFDWRIHTPLLSLAVWTVFVGWLMSLLPRAEYAAAVSASRAKLLAGYAVLFGGMLLFALNYALGESVAQVLPGAIVAGSVTLLAILFASESSRSGSNVAGLAIARALMGTGIVFGALGALISWHPVLFDQEYRLMWEELQGRVGPPWAASLTLIGAAAVAVYIAAVGPRAIGESPRDRLLPVLIYLACGGAAYATVYLLSAGYIYSGYLARHAPFTVFLTDIIVATSIYLAIKTAIYAVRNVRISDVGVGWLSALRGYGRTSMAAAAVGLAFFLVAYWLVVQISYVQWLPPTHYAFLKSLSEPPYQGASFVVDNYAAPVATYTGQWAFYDPEISEGKFALDANGIRLAGDRRYLWFADRDTNAEYHRPRYFLCMVPQTPSSVLSGILKNHRRSPGFPGCSKRPLVRLARAGTLGPALELVSADEAGFDRIGFDSWAIVKLQPDERENGTIIDWDLKRKTGSGKQEIR